MDTSRRLRLPYVGGEAVLLLAIGMLLAAEVAAQTPPAYPTAGVLDQVTRDYQIASRTWAGRVLLVTTDLFFWLALLEFAVAGIMYMIATPQAREAKAGQFLVKIMLISFVYMLITQSDYWVMRLLDSFAAVGEYAAGQIMSPSLIVDYGAALSSSVMRSLDIVGMVQNPAAAFYTVLTAFAIMLCYILIAAQVVLTLVESYIVLSSGLFFLAFAAFRSTASFAENYLLSTVPVGIKLMILYMVVGVGGPLTAAWADLLHNDQFFSLDTSPILRVLAGVAILTFVVWYIPNKVAGRITGGANLGLASAMRGNS
jgi:type IV secretion system protein TrbL